MHAIIPSDITAPQPSFLTGVDVSAGVVSIGGVTTGSVSAGVVMSSDTLLLTITGSEQT